MRLQVSKRAGFVRLSRVLRYFSLVTLMLALFCCWGQEAINEGLKGHVQTVQTEYLRDQDDSLASVGSTVEVFDPQGYQLEIYQYIPDGSLSTHTINTRSRNKIYKSQTYSAEPSQNSSVENIYDSKGLSAETNEYSGEGVLTRKSVSGFLNKQDQSSIWETQEITPAGTEETQVVDSHDPISGISHQVGYVNGKFDYEWTMESDQEGHLSRDQMVFANGSNEERKWDADRAMVQSNYSAFAKIYSFQRSDAHGKLLETMSKSDSVFSHCMFSYDQAGRPTGEVNYDESGSIVSRTTIDYRDDSFGNWIERKTTLWEGEFMRASETDTDLRTIQYYKQ